MRRIVSDEQRGPEPKSARPFGVASGSDQSDPDWSESALGSVLNMGWRES